MQQQLDHGGTFGGLLRTGRLRLGLTQEALAERSGLSRRGIADLERGARSAPYGHTVERLATALGLSDSERQALVEASRPSTPRRRPRLELIPAAVPASDGVERTALCHNLPVQPTSFVGRQRDQIELASLLTSAPLVTLVGPGGVGKTRLALEVAASLGDRFADGVWLVELAPLSDANLIPQLVAAVLAVQQRAGVDIATSLANWLRSKQMLLVLDNCEHMVDACARLASQFVRTCPDLRLLATSREVLGIAGEQLLRVDPLTIPEAPGAAATVSESEAVTLFVDRAMAAAPGFHLTEHNAAWVATLCRQLDGVPLALELAAARLRTVSIDEVGKRLDRRFELLARGSRDGPPRHRTLRTLVDWSYGLLDEDERTLFQHVSVFSGGWTLEAAEDVCAPRSGSTLDVLGQLVDKSLVQTDRKPDGTVRYRMLETLRQYAAEQLYASGKAEEVQQRRAQFFADALERRWAQVWYGAFDNLSKQPIIERDYDNLRASLRWLVDRADTPAAESLAAALGPFWALGGRFEEGRVWMQEVLDLPEITKEPGSSRLLLMYGLAQLEALGGRGPAALARLEAALPAIRKYADPPTLALTLGLASTSILEVRRDVAAARAFAEEGVRIAEATGITALEVFIRARLVHVAVEGGEYDYAEQLLEASRALDTRIGARSMINLARARFGQGQHAAAASLLEEFIAHYDANRSQLEPMLAATVLSQVRLAQGHVAGALAAAKQALIMVRNTLGRTTSFGHLAGPIEALAMVAAAAGQSARGLRLAASAEALRESYGERLSPIEHARLERWLEPARRALGRRAAYDLWAAGRLLGAEAAVDEALALKSSTRHAGDLRLTPREREVMHLAAQGLTNRQIGQALVITEGTARIHVERVLSKLELHSRAQLAAWMVRHNSD